MRALYFIIGICLAAHGVEAKIPYCSLTAPLHTKFIQATHEETRKVSGCVASERHDRLDLQVVVVRTDPVSPEVVLTVTDIDKPGLLLVLDSPRPLHWKLNLYGQHNSTLIRSVVLSPGSNVTSTNAEVTYLSKDYTAMNLSPDMSGEKFGTIVRQKYGGLTVLAEAQGATRISLSLPTAPSALLVPRQCNLAYMRSLSNHAVAFFVKKQEIFGCFHPEAKRDVNVHVIDLQLTPGSGGDTPVIIFSMTPMTQEGGDTKDAVTPRNITVFLKSQRPVRWYLESWRLRGHLRVISNLGSAENHTPSPDLKLKIERKSFPEDVKQLWKMIVAETDTYPVSHITVKDANVIAMTLPDPESLRPGYSGPGKINSLSQFVPDTAFHDAPVVPDRGFDYAGPTSEKISSLEHDLAGLVTKKCEQSDTVFALPRSALVKFNVTSLTLNEAACQSSKNATHWILRTLGTSCGSLTSVRGNNPFMSNEIHFNFAPGTDFYRQNVRVYVSCKYPPGLFGFPLPDPDPEEDSGDDLPVSTTISKMYGMQIVREKSGSNPVLLATEATVSVGDKLKVMTEFDSKSFLSLMIEKCWVSEHPFSDERSIEKDRWLIHDGCPTNPNVTMLPVKDLMVDKPSFTLTVTEKHRQMSQLYLFCIIGLCSPLAEVTTGNVPLCADPSTECLSTNWRVSPAAQQLARRGPIYVNDPQLKVEDAGYPALSHTEAYLDPPGAEDPDHAGASESPSLHSAHVVMVGVPTEIAVAISVASFLIGAALTGMLCCIHHRKALPKGAAGDRVRGGPARDPLELSERQSMLASPASAQTFKRADPEVQA